MTVDELTADMLKERLGDCLGDNYRHLVSNLSFEEDLDYVKIRSQLIEHPELAALIKVLSDLQVTNTYLTVEGDRICWGIRKKELLEYPFYGGE